MKKLEAISEGFSDNGEIIIFLNQVDFRDVMNELNEFKGEAGNQGKFDITSNMGHKLGFVSVHLNGKTFHFHSSISVFMEAVKSQEIKSIH